MSRNVGGRSDSVDIRYSIRNEIGVIVKYSELTMHLNGLFGLLSERIDGAEFSELFAPSQKPVIGDWADKSNLPIPVKGDGIGNRSGIYFFTTEDEDILYIGKATKNNLHERVWDHIQTPNEVEGKKIFPNSKFDVSGENVFCQLVRDGRVKVGIISISPATVAPLAEVYLQTIYSLQMRKTPPLCKQIG